MKDYQTIYTHLEDQVSREIFAYRVLYTETGDEGWIEKLLQMIPEGAEFVKMLREDSDTEKVIFGAGAWGKELAEILPVGWTCFVDNKKEGVCAGIPIISFDEYLALHSRAYIVLTARLHYPEMIEQLLKAGIQEDRIINMGKIIDQMSHRQYFDLDALKHDPNEIFVDCGCLDGETSKEFIKWSGDEYQHIYAFEPDTKQIEKCQKALEGERADVYCKGVWNKREQLRFTAFLEGSSYVSEEGESVIEADCLDNVLRDVGVTFIKMDIEGAEIQAIQGAKKLIQKNHPKLAISIYHRPEDIYEIPNLLLEYNPGYVFYLRHYSVSASETVLYAIDTERA